MNIVTVSTEENEMHQLKDSPALQLDTNSLDEIPEETGRINRNIIHVFEKNGHSDMRKMKVFDAVQFL